MEDFNDVEIEIIRTRCTSYGFTELVLIIAL